MTRTKDTIETLKEFAESKGGKCLSTEYINSHTKYLWEDSLGNQWEAKWYSVKQGKWSKWEASIQKSLNNVKYSIDDLCKFAHSKGGKCLSQKYTNTKRIYKWEDSEGREFKMSWDRVLQGQWSPHEKSEKLKELKSKYSIKYLKDFAKKHGGKCLSKKYIGNWDIYEWEDRDGRRFTRTWERVRRANDLIYRTTVSKPQREIYEFLRDELLIDDIELERKDIISPYELDIVSEKYKIAIEMNRLRYHNTSNDRISVDYHKNKTEMCEAAGYTLIQVYDIEWRDREKQIKQFLRSKFQMNRVRVYARKCEIKEIPFSLAKEVLNDNHIQGVKIDRFIYGMFHNGQIVAVMSLGNHPRNQSDEYLYLNRWVCAENTTVIGGLSKMCKYVQNIHKRDMITWVDRRWSDGQNWLKLGWEFISNTKPIISYYDLEAKRLVPRKDKDTVCVYDSGKMKILYKYLDK